MNPRHEDNGTADLDAEERWSRGTAVGEAAWIRLCRAGGRDPKSVGLDREHGAMVEAIRAAFLSLEVDGMDGLSDWLDMEGWAEL
jgi:hypothetical protein